MKRLLIPLLSVVPVICTIALNQTACAKLSPDQLREAIKQDKILQGEPTVTITGSEATVSGYRTETATEKDCKIDAVMAAKAIFQHDPDLARVVVRFHNIRIPSMYDEVAVSVGDVTAYGAGVISKDQLLGGMALVEHGRSATTADVPRPAATPLKPAASRAGLTQYQAYGLMLNYPTHWTAQYPQGSNVLVRFTTKGANKQPSLVELKVYPGKNVSPASIMEASAETLFDEAWSIAWTSTMPEEVRSHMEMMQQYKQLYKRSHPGSRNSSWQAVQLAKVTIAPSLTIGAGKSIKALQKAYYASAPMSATEYMRCLAFKSPQYVYQLNLLTPQQDAAAANAEFDQLLSLLSVVGPAKKTK